MDGDGRAQLAAIFGKRLAEARQLREVSQRRLGEAMGLTKQQGSSRINRYESGSMVMSMKALAEVAQALNVPAASLLAETPAMAKAIRYLATLDEVEQERLVEQLLGDAEAAEPTP